MSIEKILSVLKKQLKLQGLTYSQVGVHLGVSASSVKRLFADQSFTYQRLEQLCELIGMDMLQLLEVADEQESRLSKLTWQQEQEIVENPRLLLVGVCLINRCDFEEVLAKYNFEESELFQMFAAYDRFGVIDLLPGNHYRLKISTNFSWQAGGPIQQFFATEILGNYLADPVQSRANLNRYLWGMLSESSAAELSRKIRHLIDDYLLLADRDKNLAMAEKLTSSMLIVFKEDWEPDIFRGFHRASSQE